MCSRVNFVFQIISIIQSGQYQCINVLCERHDNARTNNKEEFTVKLHMLLDGNCVNRVNEWYDCVLKQRFYGSDILFRVVLCERVEADDE